MWEESQAKRVRREDVDSSRSSSPELALLDAFRTRQLEYTIKTPLKVQGSAEATNEDEGVFNLFARSAQDVGKQDTVVRLRSLSPVDGEGGILRPRHRSQVAEISESMLEQYKLSAMTGDAVRQLSTRYCPGSVYQWKVTTLPLSQHKVVGVATNVQAAENHETSRRTRLGKKGRIKRRQKLAAATQHRANAASAKDLEERMQREKRAKRNREKKFKKRARDKAKKGGEAAAGGESVEADADNSS